MYKKRFKEVEGKIKSVFYKGVETKKVEKQKSRKNRSWRELFFENKVISILILLFIASLVLVFFGERYWDINQVIINFNKYFATPSFAVIILLKIFSKVRSE